MYKLRNLAKEDLEQDDDQDEKDMDEADIYAGQNYLVWYIATVFEEDCVEADGEDLTIEAEGLGDINVNAGEILTKYEENRIDEDDDWNS